MRQALHVLQLIRSAQPLTQNPLQLSSDCCTIQSMLPFDLICFLMKDCILIKWAS